MSFFAAMEAKAAAASDSITFYEVQTSAPSAQASSASTDRKRGSNTLTDVEMTSQECFFRVEQMLQQAQSTFYRGFQSEAVDLVEQARVISPNDPRVHSIITLFSQFNANSK